MMVTLSRAGGGVLLACPRATGRFAGGVWLRGGRVRGYSAVSSSSSSASLAKMEPFIKLTGWLTRLRAELTAEAPSEEHQASEETLSSAMAAPTVSPRGVDRGVDWPEQDPARESADDCRGVRRPWEVDRGEPVGWDPASRSPGSRRCKSVILSSAGEELPERCMAGELTPDPLSRSSSSCRLLILAIEAMSDTQTRGECTASASSKLKRRRSA
mmetsp:Transcript_22112/g.49917  ORF Transcript_22112/g.49917 Transcript_22112/m.49917 type:complete len:214 (-) Transcript_22112:2-643(-)